jgi:hypothetical protein
VENLSSWRNSSAQRGVVYPPRNSMQSNHLADVSLANLPALALTVLLRLVG